MNAQEFEWQKKLLEMRQSLIELSHKLKLQRLEHERGNVQLFHDLTLTRERIRSAEIRKMQDRKDSYELMKRDGGYGR